MKWKTLGRIRNRNGMQSEPKKLIDGQLVDSSNIGFFWNGSLFCVTRSVNEEK